MMQKKEQKKANYQRLGKELKSSSRNDNRKWANILLEERNLGLGGGLLKS